MKLINLKLFFFLNGTHILLFVISILLLSCQRNRNTEDFKFNFINKVKSINKENYNKQICSPSLILGDSLWDSANPIILFITSSQDCQDCRKKGYNLIKKINSESKKQLAFAIGANINWRYEQNFMDYYTEVYPDEKETVKRELNLYHTPSFIVLDKNKKVIEIFSIFPYDDIKLKDYNEQDQFQHFIERVVNL